MFKSLIEKIKEASISVLPISLIVIILHFTSLAKLTNTELIVFIFSSVFLILGIGLFSLGADMAMSPMGENIGSSLIKTNKIKLALCICFILGLLITVAEPDLSVLASQVKNVLNSQLLIWTVGLGVGVFLVVSLLKIIFKKDLTIRIIFSYLIMFCAASLLLNKGNGQFLALAFDSGGVTTGPITVPFIMALGLGVAQTIGGREVKENSFGLIALCSVGPIIVMLLLCLNVKEGNVIIGDPASYAMPVDNLFNHILKTLLSSFKEVSIALLLITVFFLIIQFIFIKLSKRKLKTIGVGLIYTLLGLVIFLSSATIGFMPIGYKIGSQLAKNNVTLILIGFVIGLVVVLAEPAVHVLTKQVEEVTTGGVSKKSMLIALSLGVGISIGLSMIRIVCNFSILYYLIPGYILSLGLSFFVPKVYTAIAFDSGGVASGPLTSSFILPLAIGACSFIYENDSNAILNNGFGIVAMVAMTPLITIQLLGFKDVIQKSIKEKARTKKILSADDEQIIIFK